MNRKSKAVSKLLIIIIVVLVVGLSFLGVYFAGLFHFPSKLTFVKLIGICNATTYVAPGTAEAFGTEVTVTTDSITSSYLSIYSTSTPPTLTSGSTTYTTTIMSNSSTSFVITNTTTLGGYLINGPFVVFTCTYKP